MPVPTEPCISEQYFQAERSKVFARTWLKVGRVEDLPEPGSYFVQDIAVCATSINRSFASRSPMVARAPSDP